MIIYPQRTQKTLNYYGVLLLLGGEWQSLYVDVLIEIEYLSAKDAKGAKIFCYALLTAASDNQCGEFSDQTGLNRLN